jgi:hypothetical protein
VLAGMLAGSLVLVAAVPAFGASFPGEYAFHANRICADANAQAQRAFFEYLADKEDAKKRKKRDQLRIRLSRKELEIGEAELARLEGLTPAPFGSHPQLVAAWLDARRELQRIDERDHKLFKRALRVARAPKTKKNSQLLRRLRRKQDELFLDRRPAERADRELATQLGAVECAGAGTGGTS